MATDLERLDSLLDQQEKAIGRAFRDFVLAIRSPEIIAKIIDLLENRDFGGALQIVESYINLMANVLPRVSVAVGEATAEALAGELVDSSLAIHFDPSLPRAAEIIRANRLEFVTNFTDQQRRSTLQALDRAYREGTGTQGTARAFQGSIGLTPAQEQAVENYRQLLRTRNRDALDRALRDRRYDSSVARAIENDTPLAEERIDQMVERYRSSYVKLRAETIARTEGVRATAQASLEAAEQMTEQTGISSDRVKAVWNPTRDTRTRDWHASMAGQVRDDRGLFKDGIGNLLRYPGDPAAPAATVINCRCALTFSIVHPS